MADASSSPTVALASAELWDFAHAEPSSPLTLARAEDFAAAEAASSSPTAACASAMLLDFAIAEPAPPLAVASVVLADWTAAVPASPSVLAVAEAVLEAEAEASIDSSTG
jgi:hypothetical protein